MSTQRGLSATIAASKVNQLIAGLPSKERQQFLSLSDAAELVSGDVLCEPGAPLQHAYFPLTCLISLSAISPGRPPLGMAVIGKEGVFGATLALGTETARLRGVVFGSGLALSLSAKQLRRVLRGSPSLSSSLMRYTHVLMGQFLQTAVCNSFHEVEMRLGRWLLMADGRPGSAPINLTHQNLGDLLGVQRSAVTIAAGKLQDRKIISYVRGQISVISRSGLEDASCDCYDGR